MSSWIFVGHVLMGSAQLAAYLYRIIRPHRFGVYGPSLSGKTTLDQFLTVPGDIEPIPHELRTTHPVRHGKVERPHSTKKQVRWNGRKVPVTSADIGGENRYWNLWAEDMVERNVSIVFYVIDHRILHSDYLRQEAVAGFQYIVDMITNKHIPETLSRVQRKRAKMFKPKVVCLLLNKMDLWWDQQAANMWEYGFKRQHPLVLPFQHELRRLRKAAVATNVEAIAAQYGLNVERAVIDTVDML